MAYTAIASDLAGRLYWIDQNGTLQRSPRDDLDGESEVLGRDWHGVAELAVAHPEGDTQVLARRHDHTYAVLGSDGSPITAAWRLGKGNARATRNLRHISGLAGGTFGGVDRRNRLMEFQVQPTSSADPSGGFAQLASLRVLGSGSRSEGCLICAGHRVFTVNCKGQLVYRARQLHRRGEALGPWIVLAGGWSVFQRVCAASSTSLYAFKPEGDVLLYRFDDDGKSVRLLRPEVVGTGFVGWQGLPCRVEGYATPLSLTAGQRVDVHLGTRLSPPAVEHDVECHVDVVRLRRVKGGNVGDYDEAVTKPTRVVVRPQSLPPDWLKNGVGWPSALSQKLDRELTSGIYAARCTDGDGHRFYVPFVVRPARKRGDIAVIANTNTWNAYNSWGGWGKYVKRYPLPFTLPFERPHPGLHPEAPDCCLAELRSQTSHLLRAELWVLGWLEDQSGEFAFDVYSDHDLHNDLPELCSRRGKHRYRALILNTHPEYWTKRMYSTVLGYLHRGGSILYLGANGMYEEVEFLPHGRGLSVFPGVDASKFAAAKHGALRREVLSRVRCMPERALTGVGFEEVASPSVVGQPYQLALPPGESPALEGIRLRVGDEFGARSVNPGFAANGWEVDRRGEHTPLPARDRKALLALGKCAPASGEMLYYETGHGGVVFAASSLSAGGSLAVDRPLQRIVLNVLRIARSRSAP